MTNKCPSCGAFYTNRTLPAVDGRGCMACRADISIDPRTLPVFENVLCARTACPIAGPVPACAKPKVDGRNCIDAKCASCYCDFREPMFLDGKTYQLCEADDIDLAIHQIPPTKNPNASTCVITSDNAYDARWSIVIADGELVWALILKHREVGLTCCIMKASPAPCAGRVDGICRQFGCANCHERERVAAIDDGDLKIYDFAASPVPTQSKFALGAEVMIGGRMLRSRVVNGTQDTNPFRFVVFH